MLEVVPSFCRVCTNGCSIEVTVSNGDVIAVNGNPNNPMYRGYSCIKGRSQGLSLKDSSRLLHPLRRAADGSFHRITSGQALDEIAERLARIRDVHGPDAIAAYFGTMATATMVTAQPFYNALLDSIGTIMRFDPNTIDKGGKQIAQSFLGSWGAPSQGFDRPDAIMLIGTNPMVTYTGLPAGSPGRWLADAQDRGCKLIVIDPRETHVAHRADWFLQARAGHDAAILAAMLKVIVGEELYDKEFVQRHVTGLDRLNRLLDDLDIEAVARNAGLRADALVEAARCYARAKRGYIMAGTGPHMSVTGTLVEYLVLCIDTLCGRYLRAGETVAVTPVLTPAAPARAQARGPYSWELEGGVRSRGLRRTRAGMPTSALADEILTAGKNQVRALIVWGGNPASAFPDQERVVKALESLELNVQIDPWLSESAKLADYVLPTTLPLEVPSATGFMDFISSHGTGYGQGAPHAQYTPAIAAQPEGSDLLEEWQIFHGLLERLGYPVRIRPFACPPDEPSIELNHKPTTEELLELVLPGGRVSVASLKQFPEGHIFDQNLMTVEPGDPTNSERLDVGSVEMLNLFESMHHNYQLDPHSRFPYKLLCRRSNHIYNSSLNREITKKVKPYHPAYMHPDDMEAEGLADGDEILLTSEKGWIRAIVDTDRRLLPGTISMSFGLGSAMNSGADPRISGSNPTRLISLAHYDRYTGQPRMSNIPVAISRVSNPESTSKPAGANSSD